jgi:hypothetical protein
MTTPQIVTSAAAGGRARQLWFLTSPARWPAWPFLPLVRRTAAGEELGLLFDARGALDLTGYGATVFQCCLYALPPSLDVLLGAPREVYDSAEEVLDHDWTVD